MNIREATVEDVPKIVPVWREMMEFHAKRDGYFAMRPDAEKAFSDYVSGNIENNNKLVLIAEVDADVAGYCQCMVEQKPPVMIVQQFGSLSELAVGEKYRRQGIGENIVKRAMVWFQSKDLKRIEVRVAVCNEISTQFWRKMGFVTYLETMSQTIDLPAQA